MNDRSAFGPRLWRLLSCRRPTFATSPDTMIATVVEEAGVPLPELQAVIEGAEPSPDTVRLLAPALSIHTADMFVIAGLPVPDDVAAAWTARGDGADVGVLLLKAMRMSPGHLSQLHESVRSMPAQPVTRHTPVDAFPEGPGAMLLRLFRNRNIRPHNSAILRDISGCRYVSPSTIWMLGPGHTLITPSFVTAFALLLGYAPDDMAALVGFGPAVESSRVHPASAEIAALAWNARHLSSAQIRAAVAAVGES